MNERRDGGSAFPVDAIGHHQESQGAADKNLSFSLSGGMSLRDWFAGQALVVLASPGMLSAVKSTSLEIHISPNEALAVVSYEIADAMLEARKR